MNTGGSKFKVRIFHDREGVKYWVKLGVEKADPAASFIELMQHLGLGTARTEVLPTEKVSGAYLLGDSGKLPSGKNGRSRDQ